MPSPRTLFLSIQSMFIQSLTYLTQWNLEILFQLAALTLDFYFFRFVHLQFNKVSFLLSSTLIAHSITYRVNVDLDFFPAVLLLYSFCNLFLCCMCKADSCGL